MRSEEIREAIGNAALTVLETMFFTMPDAEAEPAYGSDEQLLCATVAVSGDWSGLFQVKVPQNSVRGIAENFLGEIDSGELEDSNVGEVLCELSNMICGAALGQLASDKIFDLGPPSLYCAAGTMEPGGTSVAGVTATRGYDLGDGVLSVTMTIEARN